MKKNFDSKGRLSLSDWLRKNVFCAKKKVTTTLPARIKTLLTTGLFFLSSQGSATGLPTEKDNKNLISNELPTGKNKTEAGVFDAGADIKTGGIYKGVEIDFNKIKAPDLGHLFESGMNPYILSSDKKYLGLYQMDTAGTVKSFLFGVKHGEEVIFEGVAKDYPQLAALGKTIEGRRSKAFSKMFGDLSKTPAFRKKMDQYMMKVKYRPVFNRLAKISGLKHDKRGEAFKASVMAAINQNPNPQVICDIFEKSLHIAEERAAMFGRQTTTAEIIQASYEVRIQRWAIGKRNQEGMKNRYREECRLALDWLKFEEKTKALKLEAQEKQRDNARRLQALQPLTPFRPVSKLLKDKKIELPKVPLRPDTVTELVKKKRGGR